MKTQFACPDVGSKIRVTTRFRETYLYSTNEWRDETVEGVVGPSHKLVAPNSFILNSPRDLMVPVREIPLERVVNLEFLDGKTAQLETVNTDVEVKFAKGSKGNVYTVTRTGKKYTCTCPGFTFRKHCKHIAEF